MSSLVPEQLNICSAFVPVDMQAAANTGDWVSLKGYEGCCVVFFKAAGTAGDDPTLTLQQATAVAGTDATNLLFEHVYTKTAVGLTLATMTSSVWTHTKQTAATNYTDATSAEVQAIWAVDIKASMLDAANNFCCIQASVADVGTNAQLGCCLYLLYGGRYGVSVSPIAD